MTSDGQRPAAMRETNVQDLLTSTKVERHGTALNQTGLPILRAALDVERMGELLRPLLTPLGALRAVQYAKLLAYKQGNRGLVRYELTTERGPAVVMGKLYPDVERVRDVLVRMEYLWAEVFGRSQTFGVPQPLGSVPDLSMLVYVPAEGSFLDEVLDSPNAPGYFSQTGQWLAALHGSALPLAREVALSVEAVHLKAWAALVAHAYPDLGQDAARLAQTLRERAKALNTVPQGPIHKDFHYRHVLIDASPKGANAPPRFCVLDFDEVRIGDPAMDVAHFCANLDLLALRVPQPVAWLRQVFVDAYVERTGWEADQRYDWFHAYTCLKITKQLCTTRGVRPRPAGVEQRRQAEAMLATGLASAGLTAAGQAEPLGGEH